MNKFSVYKDLAARTNGVFLLGIVGPVRTGKSTFVRRFMELLVLPNLDENERNRTKDELPISSYGKAITTVEPKFIPKEDTVIRLGKGYEATTFPPIEPGTKNREMPKITVSEGIEVKIRLIDCVGYMVENAVGYMEGDSERLVKTPWFDYEIPFSQAAEIGTKKVITDHSTIGIVVTTDGSIGELERDDYIVAEEKTIAELKKIGKPFVIVLNCTRPYAEETAALAREMQKKYDVIVLPINCEQLKKEDITRIMESVLKEFPISQIDFNIPKWLEILPNTHWLKEKIIELCKNILNGITIIKDVNNIAFATGNELVKQLRTEEIDLSSGTVRIEMQLDSKYYYQIVSDYVGIPVTGEYQLMKMLFDMSKNRKEYEKVNSALESVRYKGYGVVNPDRKEIILEDPVIIKHGNKYGVKMRAQAPSIHMIKAFIETEIAPIVGSEAQAEDLIQYIKTTANASEDGIWEANIFGKSIEQIVDDGIGAKVSQMTDDCQMKLQDTLQKVINDSNGGMVCIII